MASITGVFATLDLEVERGADETWGFSEEGWRIFEASGSVKRESTGYCGVLGDGFHVKEVFVRIQAVDSVHIVARRIVEAYERCYPMSSQISSWALFYDWAGVGVRNSNRELCRAIFGYNDSCISGWSGVHGSCLEKSANHQRKSRGYTTSLYC